MADWQYGDRPPVKLKSSPLLRCLMLYREMPVRFGVTSLLFALVNVSLAGQQWLIGQAINEVQRGQVVRLIDGALDYHRAWFWLALLTGFAVIRAVVQYGTGILALITGQDLLFLIRDRILIQIQRLDLTYHWQHGVGELITRTTRDADKVRDALINFWRQMFETGLVLIASTGILFWYAPWLGLVPLMLTVTGLSILIVDTDRLVLLDRAVGDAYDAVNQDLSESIHGVRVIKAFGLEQISIGRFKSRVELYMLEARIALAYASRHIPLPQIVVAASHVWVLGYGALLVYSGRLQIGDMVAALLAANTLVFRVEGIGPVMQIFADARSSAGRIWELLDAEPRIVAKHLPVPSGPLGIRLEHVRVAAPGSGIDTLHDVSFEIRPREIVALVGTTGAGKSVLMSLLPRLIDVDEGVVSIGSDEAGWRNVTDIDIKRLREKVHVVPQESFLFSDTLAANLRLGAPLASEQELREALRLAAAEEILDGLPDGLDTVIGDRGITLSGGQRQRLCLARAVLTNAAILGLDDATSALDAVTERTVLGNIHRWREKTILIVSSKLSTILMADRVLLLADGKIAAQGTHEQLMKANPIYRDLMGS